MYVKYYTQYSTILCYRNIGNKVSQIVLKANGFQKSRLGSFGFRYNQGPNLLRARSLNTCEVFQLKEMRNGVSVTCNC